MSICIVFVPVTLLSGSAKYIFTPLAVNVVLALIASYGLSRTLVPTMMHLLLPKEVPLYQGQEKESPLSRSFIWRFHQRFDRGFDWFAEKYKAGLKWALGHPTMTLVAFAVVVLGSMALIPVIGRDFFPYVDSGQMEFHVRPPAGTRIETAREVFKQVNEEIRRVIPAEQLQMVVNNIGLPPGGVNRLTRRAIRRVTATAMAGAARRQAPANAGMDAGSAAGFRREVSSGDIFL